mmetsp:Transcript_5338/g.7188  ORF Transcript_5338/g.7188 Transcript_5338/m.7188 type:complete len:409 (-) Transcript_5338:188-1414(-)
MGKNDTTKTNTPSPTTASAAPTKVEIGDHINVKTRLKGELRAAIVEKRIFGNDQIQQYYVHYVDYDRRLDEWVDETCLVMSTWDYSKRHKDKVVEQYMGSRSRKRKTANGDHVNKAVQEQAELEREHEEITKVKNIARIVMGKFEVDTWYFSPYPEGYYPCESLYICEFCLKYMKKQKTFQMHRDCLCEKRKPPGKEIYREGNVSVFEIDGREHRVYCQNLCLLAKLFLDHKTLYYDVDPFWFYIICEVDNEGAHIVGYFSKEKVSAEDYNLACILTFPQHQKKGYGKFIISLSYELSKREKKVGSPEKPLSDLGKISYRSYWTHILLNLLNKHCKEGTMKSLTIKQISHITSIKVDDILSTFQSLNMIQYWKGQHVIHVRQDLIRNVIEKSKKIRLCNSECLNWYKD